MRRLLVLLDVAMNLPTCESVLCGGSHMRNLELLRVLKDLLCVLGLLHVLKGFLCVLGLLRMLKGFLCVLLPCVAEVGTTWVPFLSSYPTRYIFMVVSLC